ncbi:LysR family transcriptional regulator [Williamsia sp. M5A3_1d]
MVVPAHVPELATLDVLVTVARVGSMNAAARDLGMSQQAVSARVHAAEREIGMAVFRRSTTGVEPTTEGVVMLEWAAAILEQAQRFSAGVGSLLGQRSATLTVASSMTIAEYLMPEWVVALRGSHPEVKVRVWPMNSTEVRARVVAGECAVGFVEDGATESHGPTDGVTARVVHHDELLLVVPPDHRWARAGRVTPATVARTALVQRESGSGTRVVFTDAMTAAGHVPEDPMLELNSVSAVRAAMLSSGSPAVLSSLSVRDDLRRGTLVAVPIDGVTMPRALRAIWDRDRGLRGPARDLVDQAIRRGSGSDHE